MSYFLKIYSDDDDDDDECFTHVTVFVYQDNRGLTSKGLGVLKHVDKYWGLYVGQKIEQNPTHLTKR